ncbi:hypothetical protein JV173_01805 [Acholeplasma equirhinis]|uniref:hypothetical protein n=1 Tax=Acholeplasma equirhinis TaxID=555393 RepID=UPI00197A8A10|nr:hypothetical protein [Acholeplasma equirhinis]MBN3490239.1 hypothetical protein [Acholeplasma equirhinis]
MESINEKEIDEAKHEKHTFESKKIMSLNKFFMKNVMWGLFSSVLLFVVSVCLLIFIIMITNMDESVKITIITMVATFILTTSKALIDRLIEVVVYIMRLLGEEQRGLNKKIGIEIDEVEFETLSEEDKEE